MKRISAYFISVFNFIPTNFMKKVIIALCAIVISANAFAQAAAQPAPAAQPAQSAPKMKGEDRKKGEKPADKAGVTPEESAKLKAATQAAKAAREAIKNDASLGANDRQAKLKAVNENKKAQTETILGKEKAEKLREERKARKGKGKKKAE
jgi:hypothetical protein